MVQEQIPGSVNANPGLVCQDAAAGLTHGDAGTGKGTQNISEKVSSSNLCKKPTKELQSKPSPGADSAPWEPDPGSCSIPAKEIRVPEAGKTLQDRAQPFPKGHILTDFKSLQGCIPETISSQKKTGAGLGATPAIFTGINLRPWRDLSPAVKKSKSHTNGLGWKGP